MGLTSYEETVANLKEAYAILCGGAEHNAGLSAGSAFRCQCAVKDALSLLEESKPKPRESKAMLPCKCGGTRREHWYGVDYEALVCKRCGFKVAGKNEMDAIRNWNKAVSESAD